ncbi:MAG: TRAP transporter fused permease subunit [Clostridiales Family XIII bacterium]|jgi:TRAP transporter 4TM/12TM fusion protein|nr:TRAP transporter fused permease subunit [Clostridiales Family XIII bacterium]
MDKQIIPTDSTLAAAPHGSLKRKLTFVFTVALVIFAILYSELFPYLTNIFFIYAESYTMYFTGIGIFLVFLNFPAKKGDNQDGHIGWFSLAVGIIGLFLCFYVGFNWESIYGVGSVTNTLYQQIMGWLLAVIVLEAARRAVGIPMVIVAVVAILYAIFGNNLSGFMHTTSFSSQKIISYLYLSSEGIFGMPVQIISTMVIAFITFGAFLSCSRAGDFYKDLALSMMGSLRGGAAKVAVLCSCLFSTMTGEPVSNTGIVGPLTLPLMKKLNYNKEFSAAAVAVSSCGSMIMPPVMAAVAFLMGQMTGLGYAAIVTAAIIPAILFYCAVFWQIDFYASKHKYKAVTTADIPHIKNVLREGWIYLIPIAVLIYFLLVVRWTPSGAIYRSLGIMIIIALIRKRDRDYFVPNIKRAFFESGISSLPTIAVSAAAGIIMCSVTITGLGLKLSSSLGMLAHGNLLILAILAAVTIYIMGMGMAPIVSYILMAILVAPAMVNLGVPVIAAHFFILYMSISSFITPPFALASYMAGSMVGVDGMKVSFKAMRLGIACFLIPFVCIFSPELLLIGAPIEIALSAGTAFAGIIFVSAALEGYMISSLNIWQRILCAIGGMCLFIPGVFTDIIGIAIISVPSMIQFRVYRRNRQTKLGA